MKGVFENANFFQKLLTLSAIPALHGFPPRIKLGTTGKTRNQKGAFYEQTESWKKAFHSCGNARRRCDYRNPSRHAASGAQQGSFQSKIHLLQKQRPPDYAGADSVRG